jgi:hypothetical protein
MEYISNTPDLGTRKDVSGQTHAPAALTLEAEPPVPIRQEAGWAPEQVWATCIREENAFV